MPIVTVYRFFHQFKIFLTYFVLLLFPLNLYAADLPNTRARSVGMSAERLRVIDAGMEIEIASNNKAGIVVLVARKGKVVHHQAYGAANIETGQAMEIDSLFRLYSMTKPITSVALLTLFEQGKFQLSDPLDKYIPEMANLQVYTGMDADGNMILEAPNRKPTIQDVFRHTAGFSYGNSGTPVDEAYAAAGLGYGRSTSLKHLVTEQLSALPLLYQPGERWVYSFAHDIQAYLVEYFSGMPFDAYLQQTIFDPLDMGDTFFGVPAEMVGRYTANYSASDDGGLIMIENQAGERSLEQSSAYIRYTDTPFGGSGLSSTVMDYAKFATMLVNGGELNGERILGRKTVELMSMNHLPDNIGSIDGGADGYGLGVQVMIDQAALGNLGSLGQFGWAGAATTWVVMDPEEDMVSILMTQFMPTDFDIYKRWQAMVYQALVD